MKRLQQLQQNEGGSYILPFLWMHGEPLAIMQEEIDRIAACGIREFCLESRPYPGFGTDSWWKDVGDILAYAQQKQMRVWILDDDKFPTGHANGAFVAQPEKAKWYLAERHMDIMGPATQSAVLIEPFLHEGDTLLAVLALPKPDGETLAVAPAPVLDFTNQVHDGFVYFDLPAGSYRLFVLFQTQQGGGRKDYVNLLDSASVQVLIDAVYEQHYTHFAPYFGNTLAGFFSDEPEIGNTPGYDFQEKLGQAGKRLPWSDALAEALQQAWGPQWLHCLPALWYPAGAQTSAIRYTFMEQTTRLIAQCFSAQLSHWCAAHQIEYIGHIIEDDNAHGRLGCSIGHYFRAQHYQHRAGIDVVHHQIVPGFTERVHQWIAGDADGEFFHYGLAKMGSSLSHLRPQMQGRALCEIFGNYGWAEGVSLMKWLTDHMLVRGINCFVPHAFSPAFPDRDCPPHFYARGNNPQYQSFAALMQYMNRVSHLLSGGVHQAQALVLYHADSEWGGEQAMLFQKPVRALLESQLDCDVISADLLDDCTVEMQNDTAVLCANGETYGCLIIPCCAQLPPQAVAACVRFLQQGVPVLCVDKIPAEDTLAQPLPLAVTQRCEAVPLATLAQVVRRFSPPPFTVAGKWPQLRTYAYRHADGTVLMLYNESVETTVNTTLTWTNSTYTAAIEYDAMANRCTPFTLKDGTLRVQLYPGQSAVYILQNEPTAALQPKWHEQMQVQAVWQVSCRKAGAQTEWQPLATLTAPQTWPNWNGPQYDAKFSGVFRYEADFACEKPQTGRLRLRLPAFADSACVWLNGQKAGFILTPQGTVEVTELLHTGKNRCIIEITNTLVWQVRDGASTHLQVYATGLQAAPVLEWTET